MNKKIIFCLIVTFLLTTTGSAATLNVPGGYATIQAAINAATSGDTIEVANGNYTPPAPDGYDFAGKDITLQSLNGPANCIIDCNNNGRAFYFHTGETPALAVVRGFTIENGDEYYGGAIEFEEASATIDNCIITNSTAVYGGAIDCFYASPDINNCIITQNTSYYDGGAIECSSESSPDIINCLITNNNSINGFGGAIDCYDLSSPAIKNCTIVDNTGASNKGGVYADNVSHPTIRNSILWNNIDDIIGNSVTSSYSCIEDPNAGTGNIHTNPKFKTGPSGNYYLSQILAGQLTPNSPCFNTGGDLASTIFGSGDPRTTMTNNIADSGTVDMGFHYLGGGTVVQYKLITSVVNEPNGHGSIIPSYPAPTGHDCNAFTEVLLTASPVASYTVEKWTGTDNDTSTVLTNVVTMDANHTVTVKFRSTVPYQLTTSVINGINGHGQITPLSGPQWKDSTVLLTAIPDAEYTVKRWSGTNDNTSVALTNTVTMTTTPKTVSVEFTLTVPVSLDTQVVNGPDGLPHGTILPKKRDYYPLNSVVQLFATPDPNYKVKEWTYDANIKPASGINANTVTMTSNKLVKVEFEPITQFTLTTNAKSGATITPYYPAGKGINKNEVVPLTATIPAGTVIDWSIDGVPQNTLSLTNTVTMSTNHNVYVSYHTPQVLHVPGQYSSIQNAINHANDGDRIIVAQRAGNPYRETNIDTIGRLIHISSEHPDDPCCVAATVIDCEEAGRAFILHNSETQDTIIEGLTIINGSPTGPEPQTVWENDSTASSHGENALGGAILCTNNASPTISNCVFKNCRAEGKRGKNSIYVYPAPPTPTTTNGAAGSTGGTGIPGGNGGHGLGGALYFDTNCNPRILHCKIINCQAIGGNSGRGANGGDGGNGASGNETSHPSAGGGGVGGGGGDGGTGGNGTGGAIYFEGQNNAVIQYCNISSCSVKPGLGNSAGSGGNGGNGGSGAGLTGTGGDGGAGGYGGNGGTNGTVTAGGIYSGDDGSFQISDTTFSGNYTSIDVESFRYNPGNGGNGGTGGNGTGGDGDGGAGGNGGKAGNAGDDIYIGDGANGGNGGNGGGTNGTGGNGGHGSDGFRSGTDGQGGQGGDGGSSGTSGRDGIDGNEPPIEFYLRNEAGCNRYNHNCTIFLTNCNFLENYTAGYPGGAEYYGYYATAVMNNCTFSENSAGTGGAQCFSGAHYNIDINDSTYSRNISGGSGGGVFAGEDVNLTVKNSTFADNISLGSPGWGGGIHWDNLGYSRTVSVTDSYFINNMAGFGGGLHWNDDALSTTTVTNCVFNKNSADHGAGLYWSEGSPTISGCIFTENQATGRWVWLDSWTYSDFFGGGGGIFSFSSNGTIKDCAITDNTTSGSGGGIYAGGGAENLKIHNCLITNNSATIDGGGISLNWFVTSQITNCTIAENTAYDPTDTSHGYGGGVSCTYESNTTMTDNILWDNIARLGKGNQISLGNSSDPAYLQKPAELTISYSDIQNWKDTNEPDDINPDEIYIYQSDRIISIDANNVIDDDPCFVQAYDPCLIQTYFLEPNNPCVNTGSDFASTIGLDDTYTTQTNNSFDTGKVDMGYHYALNELTVVEIGNGRVRVDPNNYDPNSGTYFGSILGLIAEPDPGYRVKSWTGADVFPGWNTNTNTVTMTSDKVVTVEFEVEYNRILHVPGDFAGIQDAINAAQNGDIILLTAGTYAGTGFTVDRKNITILGDPAHPETVVIDCSNESTPVHLRPKGFVLIGDNYYSTTLNGLSIINSNTITLTPSQEVDEPGYDGQPTKLLHDIYDWSANYGGAITIQGNHTVKNCIIRNCTVRVSRSTDGVAGGDPNNEDTLPGRHKGGDGGYGGNAGGGGIYIQWGNAQITNVTVENCAAYAGDAGNGATGYENENDNYPPGESGRGGDGGSVAGGGIYVRSGNPVFTNVTVRDSIARAGRGGNGATGAIGADGGDGGLSGRVKGAGVYCAVTSAPTFVNCTIENCRGYGGLGGNGGDGGEYVEDEPATEGGYGGLTTETAAGQGDIRMYSTNGGAVFCDDRSRATFTDCTFADNMTYGSISGIGGLWHLPADWREQPRKNYRVPSFGAGVFCSTDSSTGFTGCLFENNRTAYNQDYNDPNYLAAVGLTDINDYDGEHTGVGGGLCLWSATSATISDCSFILNSAPIGGGIYSDQSGLYISGSNLTNNVAYAGGGMLAVDSTATVNNSQFKGNVAGTISGYYSDTGYALFGTGGGIYALDTPINISDTVITENYARFTGGGVCFDGDTSYVGGTVMKNCLVTENRAAEAGGGIASIYFSEPAIQNCTIVDNYVTDVGGTGGGLFCSYASEAIVKDTIFWSNSGIDGSQIALSDGGPFADMPASLDISYSDMQNAEPTDTVAIDIVICIDTTGSMNDVLDSMKEAASDIVDKVAEKTTDYRIAVVDFKDFNTAPYGGGTDYPFRDDTAFTSYKDIIQTAIDGLEPSGGADWEESVYSALMHSIDGSSLGNWRSDTSVNKIIILMGDAPPHDPEPNTAYTLETVTEAANDKGINIFSILTGSGVGNPTPTSFFQNLASDTGGVLIESPDGSTASDAVMQAIELATTPSMPIYTEGDSEITGFEQDANDNWIVLAGSNNITEDPNFVGGYYLSHIAAGQDVDSICINAGSDTAIALGLDTYTTRVDGIFDTGIVDIGYHYKYGVPQYDITVRILTDTNDPGIHGDITADPNELVPSDSNATTYTYRFYEGQVPTFTATADANHFVKGWYNKNNTIVSHNNTFTITVEADAAYFVRFTGGRTVSVSGGGDDLRNAVEQAENRDILVVSAGTYFGDIDLLGKQIKLYGVKPDDPNVTEKTIIDCSGSSGFIFSGGETADTVLSGFTIINGGGTDGKGGGILINANSSPTIANVDINDCNALSGGGIYIGNSSNPKFEKVNISNCSATGNGGGVYIGTDSSPIFEDCLIANCNAGTNGGAAYCGTESSPFFTDCSFSGNNAADSGGGIFYGTSCDVHIEDCTFTGNSADYDAGAIMCGQSCSIDIYDCEIADSNAGNCGGGIFIDKYSYGRIYGRIRRTTLTGNDALEDGGAIFITDSDAIDIGNCNIIFNTALRGGGIYALESPEVIIYDCSIHSNKASQGNDSTGQGGGIYAFTSIEQIANCKIRDNYAETSGGGIYIAGKQNSANVPIVFNCLITENTANRDGGGISSNWLAEPLIRNCTFYNNGAVLSSNSYGGGLSCAYEADTEIINSIFWNNYAIYGRAISIGSDFDAANKLSAEVTVSYSDIMDANSYSGAMEADTAIFVDIVSGCKVNPGAGNFAGTGLDSPLFVEGSFGSFYLMQTATGDPNQDVNSPCVDTGSDTAINNDMYRHTTRTDHVLDIADSYVDMGYHYTLIADILGDFNFDGTVDTQDLYLFIIYWLDSGCKAPFFCHGRDLNEDGQVDFVDFAKLAENYGFTETVSPEPDPMTWKKVPRSTGPSSITMTATKAVDYSGSPIKYYFDCVDGNCHDSNWISSSTYIDTGLVEGQRYGYQVKAQDVHGNETEPSECAYATTGQDTSPPEPDPMEWAAGREPAAISSTSIKMTAKTATDDTPPVQYQFECIEDPNFNSGWRTDPNYTATGLAPETEYTFKVRARDNADPKYYTQYSDEASATTLPMGTPHTLTITKVGNGSVTKDPNLATYSDGNSVELTATAAADWVFNSWSGDATGSENPLTITMDSDKDITATFTTVQDINAPTYTPDPDYGMWVITPRLRVGYPPYYHTMTAVTATDAQSPPVSYRFVCVEGGGISSGWRSTEPAPVGYGAEAATYTVGPFGSANWSTYQVHIKDAVGNEVVSSKWHTYWGEQ